MFATSAVWKSLKKVLRQRAGLLAKAALARHRAIGGHARGASMGLGQGEILGCLRLGAEEHLVRGLPAERWVWHLRVVLAHARMIVFFEEDVTGAPNPEGAVGSLGLDLSGAEGFKLETMKAAPGVPVHLIRELWASFRKRHEVGVFLRRRQAQCKAVGRTLRRLADEPVRAPPQPGRNAPCPCGSGRKYKKCCLGTSEPARNDP